MRTTSFLLLVIASLSFQAAGSAQDGPRRGTANAEPAPDLEEGARRFRAGVAALSGHNYVLAEREFRASLDIAFRPSCAYNLAMALEGQGKLSEAISLYERLRALPASDVPPPHTHASLEEDRRQAIAQQATLRVVIAGAPEASLTIDGAPAGTFVAGTAIALPVDPGPHRLVGVAAGRETRVSLDLEPGEQRDVQLHFAPDAQQVAEAAIPAEEVDVTEEIEAPRPVSSRRSGVIYWIIGGVLVAGAAVALGLAFRPTSPGEESVIPVWTALGSSR